MIGPVALRSRCLAVALALVPAFGHAATLYECEIDGGPTLVSGPELPVVPEPCRALSEAALGRSEGPEQLTLESISRRLDQQEAVLERLARQVERLGGVTVRPAVRAPVPRSPALDDARDRMRDLGQEIDRKLDDLAAGRRGLGGP